MKENLFKFLFGDKPIPEQMPKILFKDNWPSELDAVNKRIATLIVSLVPSCCLKYDTQKTINSVALNLGWEHEAVINAIMTERELEPLKSRNEFVEFLCRYLLEHEGDMKGGEV